VSGPARRLRVAYDAAFWSYLLDPGEATLHTTYELGRDAVTMGLSVLDLAAVHHEVLAAAVRQSRDADEVAHVVQAAGDVLQESLSAYEMVARGFREAREAALLERRQAAVVRQLSTFLADAALAMEGDDSLAEVLRLVAEQARELLAASRCEASLLPEAGGLSASAVARGELDRPALAVTAHGRSTITADLTTLDGRALGSIRLERAGGSGFTDADAAVLAHLAQMASAAVERGRLYRDQNF
jgi:hypothetical protein